MLRVSEESARSLPVMGQQLVDAAIQVTKQPCEYVFQVHPRVVAMHTGRLHQAHDDSGALAGEQPCISYHGPGAHAIFNMVVVDGHVAVWSWT